MLLKVALGLGAFNEFMERVALPRKERKRLGNKLDDLHVVTIQVVLDKDEAEDLNNPMVSDDEKARIVAEGLRRNAVVN